MDIITIEKNGQISGIKKITHPQALALYKHMEKEHTKLIGTNTVTQRAYRTTAEKYIPAAKQAGIIIRGVMKDLFK